MIVTEIACLVSPPGAFGIVPDGPFQPWRRHRRRRGGGGRELSRRCRRRRLFSVGVAGPSSLPFILLFRRAAVSLIHGFIIISCEFVAPKLRLVGNRKFFNPNLIRILLQEVREDRTLGQFCSIHILVSSKVHVSHLLKYTQCHSSCPCMNDADLDPFVRAGASLPPRPLIVVGGAPLRPRWQLLLFAFLAGLQSRMSKIGDGGLKSCRVGAQREGSLLSLI